MINKPDNREIVILGAWNIAIFTPEWMQKYIFQPGQEVEIHAPIGLGASLRFTTQEYIFAIVGNRLEMSSQTGLSQSYEKMIEDLRKICRLLPHTPVMAIGVNIGLNVGCDKCTTNNVFNQEDTSSINEYLGVVGEPQCNIERVFKLNDIETLRLTTCHNVEEGKVMVDCNYNYLINSIEHITSKVLQDTNDLIVQKRQYSIDLLKQVYGIE